MPLSKYRVRNEYSLADPELYRAADKDDPEALLEAVAMAGLVGLLRQLGDLAESVSSSSHYFVTSVFLSLFWIFWFRDSDFRWFRLVEQVSSLKKGKKNDKSSGIFEVCGGVSLNWKDCVLDLVSSLDQGASSELEDSVDA